jgi:hypothetical protein
MKHALKIDMKVEEVMDVGHIYNAPSGQQYRRHQTYRNSRKSHVVYLKDTDLKMFDSILAADSEKTVVLSREYFDYIQTAAMDSQGNKEEAKRYMEKWLRASTALWVMVGILILTLINYVA